MVELTLFEINLEGSSFSASPPFGGDDGERVDEPATAAEDESTGGPGRGLAVLVGLVFLVVAALLVRRTLGGEDALETP